MRYGKSPFFCRSVQDSPDYGVLPPGQQGIFPQEECTVKKKLVFLGCGGLALMFVSAFIFSGRKTEAAVTGTFAYGGDIDRRVIVQQNFDVEIIVNGRSLDEYAARGKTYIEAIAGAEY